MIEVLETVTDEVSGATVPRLPWEGMPVNARWTTAVDEAGRYSEGWLLAVVAGDVKTHEQIERARGVYALPDETDKTLSELPPGKLVEVRGEGAKRGVDLARLPDTAKVDDVVEALGRKLRPSFDVKEFVVPDVAAVRDARLG